MAHTPAVDDTDDLYGTPSANNTPAVNNQSASDYIAAKQSSTAPSHLAGIPGLGMIASPPPASADLHIPDAVPEPPAPVAVEHQATVGAQDDSSALPTTTTDAGPQVTIDPEIVTDEPSTTSAAQVDAPTPTSQDAAVASPDVLGNTDAMTETLPSASKPPIDPEFLEAAKAQKGEKNAEWQFDSSDAESSSDDSSDDSSSNEEDSDEEGYELLDPATAARMLMEEGGMDDDDGPGKSAAQSQLRTKNEQPEQIIPKPDVTVTPDMKITPLGLVQHVVENLILIRAFTSGEYQVLESGSVLCLENREVIGAVQDTLGKVEEPLYSVAFTKSSDITDLNISEDSQIFYIDSHSTFVFTQPLKNLKGTDASNLHDEEVAEEEMEFSDDEAELAYKRAKKQAKKGARAQPDQPPPPSARPYTGGAMNYDDEPEGEEMYTPLARPDNLQEMMAGGAPSLPSRRQFNDRGGRGRGRGRGDRGRGDRGRGGRGGRGGADLSHQRKGPANSYPDSHNSQTQNTAQQQLPQRPVVPQTWSQNQPQMNQNVPFAFPQFGQQQFPPPPPLPQSQSSFPNLPFAWTHQAPNPQQFFMNSQQQQQQPFQYPTAPPTPGGSIPAGAFVNPAFFQTMQQQPQQQPQQQQQTHPAPAATTQNSGPSPEAIQAAQDLWRRLANQQRQ